MAEKNRSTSDRVALFLTGLALVGICLFFMTAALPDAWIGCDDQDCHQMHMKLAQRINYMVLGFSGCAALVLAANYLFTTIKNKFDPNIQAAEQAKKRKEEQDDRITAKARELAMDSTHLSAGTLYALFEFDAIPQEFIERAAEQLENNS